MRSILLLLTLLLVPVTVAGAQTATVTTKDIIELSRAGLPEEVLLAVIEVHRPVFPVDSATLKGLKDAGVPPNVIIAMIKSGREVPAVQPPVAGEEATSASTPAAQVVHEHERHNEPAPRVIYEERVREIAVPVPIYIPVRARPIHRPDPKPAEPVYWGFGGKLRPDAWKTAADVQKDARVPREPQRK